MAWSGMRGAVALVLPLTTDAGRSFHEQTALREIDTLAAAERTRDDSIRRLRAIYDYPNRRLAARAGKIDDEENHEDRSLAWQQMLQLVLEESRPET